MKGTLRLFGIAVCLCLLASAAAEDRFFDSDGIRIRYVDLGPRDGDPVVLIHGGFNNVEGLWGAGVIDALDEDYRVIALDLRGHGKSDKPHHPEAYGAAFGEDVIRLLDHLKIDKAHLVGYSMGGRIVFQLVAAHPDRILSAMPSGTDGEPISDEMLAAFKRAVRSLEQSGSVRPVLDHFNQDGRLTEEEIEEIVETLRAMNDAKALAAMLSNFGALRPDRARLESNTVPCLAVIGEHDPNRPALDRTREFMPRLEVQVLEDENHMTAFRRPEFVAAIRDFLGKHARRKPVESSPKRVEFVPSDQVRIILDLVYARYGERELRLDLYLPRDKDSGPVPGIVVVHGGGWRSGDKSRFAFIASRLAEAGFAAASVEYRLSGEAPYPAAVHDVKAATRWMRANAKEYGIAEEAIGSIGGSAGGHLSILLATSHGVMALEGAGGNADTSSRVQAAVGMAAPANFLELDGRSGSGAVPAFLTVSRAEHPEVWAQASPQSHVDPTDPPLLLMHSDLDRVVPIRQSIGLAESYEKAGLTYELVTVPGAPHAFWNFEKWSGHALDRAIAFFTKHLDPGPDAGRR